MNNDIKLSAIVPIFNEEESIKKVIPKLKNVIESLGIDYEIITVNDGSSDNSLEELNKIQGIRVIDHKNNRGYGASLKTGIKFSRYDWILIIDADETYPIEAIPKLVKNIDGNDLVVGSRHKKGNAIPFERKHAKKFLNAFASYLAGKKIPDLNSGLRLFRKEIVLKYWGLFPQRFSFTSTLTMICATRGYELIFVPIDYYKRAGKSSIKATDFFNFLKLVLKLSLFFKPFKVFFPLSLFFLILALIIPVLYFFNITEKFYDTTFVVTCATALQVLFFGLLAEIVVYSK